MVSFPFDFPSIFRWRNAGLKLYKVSFKRGQPKCCRFLRYRKWHFRNANLKMFCHFLNFPFILGGQTSVYPKVLLCSLLGIYLNPAPVNRNLPYPGSVVDRKVHEESLWGELKDLLFLKLSLLSLPTLLRNLNVIPKGPGIFKKRIFFWVFGGSRQEDHEIFGYLPCWEALQSE